MSSPRSLSVLFAPAHYALDADYGGSEYYWAYALLSTLGSQFDLKGCAVTGTLIGEAKIPSSLTVCQIRPSKPPDLSIRGSVQFALSCSVVAAAMLSRHRFDLIHHILPFRINRTSNLLALLWPSSQRPFVIGPVQVPLDHADYDAGFTAARRLDQARSPCKAKAEWEDRVVTLMEPALRVLSTATLRRASIVIAVNNSARTLYSKFMPAERIRVIPPGVDTARFGVKEPRTAHEPIRVLSCGYLIRRKRFDMLLRSFAYLVRRWRRVELWIVGEGPERDRLEQLARNLHIIDHVKFFGFIPHKEIHQYYAQADIYCTTSLSESFGQTILEAMAAGLPVVATTTVGAAELVRHEETGLLVRLHDELGISEALERLIADSQSAQAFGQRGREIAERDYDWHAIAAQYFALYNQLIGK